MGTEWLLALFLGCLLIKEGEGILCHRCFSAMGGCGQEGVNIFMFPWRDCGPSSYCVKVIEEVPGQYEPNIIRECEHILMRSTRHRLAMSNLRRHNYCLKGRLNNPWNPLQLYSNKIEYCFCNEYPGCNSADSVKRKLVPVVLFSSLMTFVVSKLF